MNIKNQAVKVLGGRYPLVALLLDQCELEMDGHEYHTTIHLHAPAIYILEQLECKAMWPKVHEAIMEVIGRDFTLNFVRDSAPLHAERARFLQRGLYKELIRRIDDLIQWSEKEKDTESVARFLREKEVFENIRNRVEHGESIWLSTLISEADQRRQAS